MSTRRKFLTQATIGTLSATYIGSALSSCSEQNETGAAPAAHSKAQLPIIISTWDFGKKANQKAMEVLNSGGSALDAVEKGVMVIEADPTNLSVGIGGLPDRDGRVTLDACIMDEKGNAGSVCALEHIVHPVSVARKVMESTPHVMLVGAGALEFALASGFTKKNLLTEKSIKAWEKWKVESKYEPQINSELHDTIGMLAIDQKGNLSGACTTSGLAFKMQGRVGDSPVIGAGLFVDNEVGAAAATGLGEMVLKTLGSFLIVELMRNGRTPKEACKEAVMRITQKYGATGYQVGFIALNKAGESGAFAVQEGFNYALTDTNGEKVLDSEFLIPAEGGK